MPDVLGGGPLVPSAPPAPAYRVKSTYGSFDPKKLRGFDDPKLIRRDIYDGVLKGFQSLPPLETPRHRLRLADVHYADSDKFPLADEKKAILRGETLARRLRGTWTLETLDGQALDKRVATVARVPHLTDEGTYVLGGTKWSLASQPRLLSGVYTRRKESGDYESHVNVLPGKGLSHRIHLDPETGVFRMNVAQAELPLLPILKALGATEPQIRQAWGNKLWVANASHDSPIAVEKLLRKLRKPDAGPDPTTRSATLRGLLEAMELDPEVTKRTLGKPFAKISAEQVLATTNKLLAVSRGEVDPDDRDHLAFQRLHGQPELFAERAKTAHRVLRPLLWRAGFKGNLDPVVAGALSRHLRGTITDTGLGNPLEEVNSLEVLDQLTRISRMGEGGIRSTDSVPAESRAVQPSYFCYDDQTLVLSDIGWLPWREVTLATRLACRSGMGQCFFAQPEAVIHQHYEGEMYGLDAWVVDYLVTPGHRMLFSTTKRPDHWSVCPVEEIHGKRRRFAARLGVLRDEAPTAAAVFEIPEPPRGKRLGRSPRGAIAVDMDAWLDFLAWYLAEGYFRYHYVPGGHKAAYHVSISQSEVVNSANCKRIDHTLSRLPFRWTYQSGNQAFHLDSKHLAWHLKQFGKAGDKFIPAYVFKQSCERRLRFLDILMRGDGHHEDYTYVSSSLQLAHDVHALACFCGYTASIGKMDAPSHLAAGHNMRYIVHVHRRGREVVTCREQAQFGRYSFTGKGHYTTQYSGMVHCAQVPGGLVYVMRNGHAMWCGNSFVDALRTPESMAAGVDLRLSTSARRSSDGTLYAPFKDPRTGELLWKNPREVSDLSIAFPGELSSGKKHVAALRDGKMRYVRRSEVDLVVPEMEDTFNHLSNMIPLKSTVKGQRVAMGSRYLTQALPLVVPEAPLVRSGVPWANNLSYAEMYGTRAGAVRAEAPGVVTKVEPGKITVRGEDGKPREYETYSYHPLNRKTALHNTPTVEVGQPIRNGDLLARSNFTDDKGVISMGLNLRTAYYPWQGSAFEDAVSISESASKRLSSQHLYQHDVEWEKGVRGGKRHFLGLFPSAFDRRRLEALDDDGVVKVGQTLEEGDPVILASRQRERAHNQVMRGKEAGYADASTVWGHATPGVVRDVEKTPKGVFVSVTTESPMREGDKLSGNFGDKGVISRVIADDEMPTDAQGKPYELLLNPQGIITRANPAQVIEAVLGKIARKTGRPYVLKDFGDVKDWAEFAEKELAQNGLTDTETVIDQRTGRRVPGILTGERFIMKLLHTSAAKGQGRGTGSYTSEGNPSKGGATGSKKLGLLDLNALLSHGATGVARDAFLNRGQRNLDFWSAFLTGQTPPAAGLPTVNRKFFELLRAAGVNPVRENQAVRVMAMTNKDVDEWAGDREIKNAETVSWKEGLKPLVGGLFDPTATGGHGGNRWSAITMVEPMLNPIMEDPARRLLGLTRDGFRQVIAGKKDLGDFGSGPSAIAKSLTSLSVDREIAATSERVRAVRGASRDDAVRKLRYLKKTKELGIHPGDWVLQRAPVLPPMFRPVSLMTSTKQPLVADLNLLYKDLIDANDNLREATGRVDDIGEERLALYDALAAVTGLGDPINPATQEKNAEGALAQIFGCYDDDTEILTKQGWVRFPQYHGDSEVATLNPRTGAFEWQMPTEVQHYRYIGEMAHIKRGKGLDILVTPSHRNWVRKRSRRAPSEYQNLELGWKFEPAYKTLVGGGRTWIRTSASGWSGHEGVPSFIIATSEQFANFVGWWAAEGWLAARGYSVQIAQAVKNVEHCRSIEAAISSLGLPYSSVDRLIENSFGKCLARQWTIGSKKLADWLKENVGCLSHAKRLSRFVLDWSMPCLLSFLTGYAHGDGARRDVPRVSGGGRTYRNTSQVLTTHGRFSTTSCELMDNIQEIAAKVGLTVKITYVPVKAHINRPPNRRPCYRGSFCCSRFAVLEGRIKKEMAQYDGHVHCCSVPNGILFVRRNGKPFFSGNSRPKFSFLQKKLLSTTTDLVGRSVIAPDADLDMDSVGLPENQAWEVYKPFVIRRLVRRGTPPLRAAQEAKDRTDRARQAMIDEMKERPVFMSRAPVLHRYGVMAFWPKLISGDTLKVSPLIVKGFNADFDGDMMNFHVPVSDDAVKDAVEKMLPSKNLFSIRDFQVHQLPSNEFSAGLYEGSTAKKKGATEQVFRTTKDVVAAWRSGELDASDPVVVLEP